MRNAGGAGDDRGRDAVVLLLLVLMLLLAVGGDGVGRLLLLLLLVVVLLALAPVGPAAAATFSCLNPAAISVLAQANYTGPNVVSKQLF